MTPEVWTIWKFEVRPIETQTIDLPDGARFLDVQIQHDAPWAWFLVDPAAPKAPRRFVLAGTGHLIPEPDRLVHLGTFQLHDGLIVMHLFEYAAEGARS